MWQSCIHKVTLNTKWAYAHLVLALLPLSAAQSAVLACRPMGPHRGGFLPRGDSCEDCLLTRPGSGSMSLVGEQVGRLIATGPTHTLFYSTVQGIDCRKTKSKYTRGLKTKTIACKHTCWQSSIWLLGDISQLVNIASCYASSLSLFSLILFWLCCWPHLSNLMRLQALIAPLLRWWVPAISQAAAEAAELAHQPTCPLNMQSNQVMHWLDSEVNSLYGQICMRNSLTVGI